MFISKYKRIVIDRLLASACSQETVEPSSQFLNLFTEYLFFQTVSSISQEFSREHSDDYTVVILIIGRSIIILKYITYTLTQQTVYHLIYVIRPTFLFVLCKHDAVILWELFTPDLDGCLSVNTG